MKENRKKKYNVPKKTAKHRLKMNIVYLCSLAVVFETIGLALIILPRSTESMTENRELAKFPEFDTESYFNGEYTSDIAKWFSDTVPYRDNLTEISNALQALKGVRTGGNNQKPDESNSGLSSDSNSSETASEVSSADSDVSAPVSSGSDTDNSGETSSDSSAAPQPETSEPAPIVDKNHLIQPVEVPAGTVDLNANISFGNNSVVTVGTRAFELYSGNFSAEEEYAAVINKYKEALGEDVNVYSMVIPTACEFYAPPSVKEYCSSARENINHIIENLNDVQAVDVYTPLAQHANEDIYLRTDHHWAPLGAYYAAKAFAETAGVPFKELSEFEQRVTHDFVGTMYGFSGDIVIKQNPEDFVYYVPKNTEYTTTRYVYELEDGKIVGAMDPIENCKFFYDFMDGSPNAYLTFMEGDPQIVHVQTSVKNGRKLAIFKDSYGNALPGYLFNSFEEIYVLDFRYFTHNFVDFAEEHEITDLLFANNAFNASSSDVANSYSVILTQEDWGI